MQLSYLQAAIVAMLTHIFYWAWIYWAWGAAWYFFWNYFGSNHLISAIVFGCMAIITAFVLNKVGILGRIKFVGIQQNELKLGFLQFGFVSVVAFLWYLLGWNALVWAWFTSKFDFPLALLLEGLLFASSVLLIIIAADFVGNDGKKTQAAMKLIRKAIKAKKFI